MIGKWRLLVAVSMLERREKNESPFGGYATTP